MLKKVLFLVLSITLIPVARGQFSRNDSLNGFDYGAVAVEAHLKGLSDQESKFYVGQAQRQFLREKYDLPASSPSALPGKPGGGTVMNAPCVDEDFESLSTGTLSSGAWTAQISDNTLGVSVPCNTGAITYTNDNTYALVVTTPVTDTYAGTITASPLGGSKVLSLNRTNFTTRPVRVRQTFSVSTTNNIYTYAYQAILNAGGSHTCCELPSLYFNFYDCSGNIISGVSFSIIPTGCVFANPDSSQWLHNSNGIYYTPNWVIRNANLSAYIGSCVTVEVMAVGCIYTGHEGYLYYDASCTTSLSPPYLGGAFTPTYATCNSPVKLSAPGGLNYTWLGPNSSGVSGSSLATISTSVSGTYTVVTTSGSLSTTNTLNLTVYPVPNITIAAAVPTLCYGQTGTLVANSQVQTSYTWVPSGNSNVFTVTPNATSVYTVTGQSTAGCTSTATATLYVLPQITGNIAPSSNAICSGQQVTLTATTNYTGSTIQWNTSAQGNSVVVSPTVTTVYDFTTTTPMNCTETISMQLTVFDQPEVQVACTAPSVCAGSTLNVYVTPTNGVIYQWTTSTNTLYGGSVYYDFVTQSKGYTVTVTDVNGCVGQGSSSVAVHPIPSVSIITTPGGFCAGESTTLAAVGNSIVSYHWQLGASTPTPGGAFYTFTPTPGWWNFKVNVMNAFGCTSWAAIYPEFRVAQNDVSIYTTFNPICAGQETTIWAYGDNISSYHWSTNENQSSIVVSPTITTTYTLTSIGDYGCPVRDYFTLQVENCDTGVNESKNQQGSLTAWPNPTGDAVHIRSVPPVPVVLFNSLGQNLKEFNGTQPGEVITITGLEPGVYYIKNGNATVRVIVKR